MARILIIEDDQALRKVYTTILTKEGHAVEAAEDGLDGLRRANANEPDLILLDIMMPKLDGIEFLRQYDVVNKHPKTKVIAFSNSDVPDRVQKAMALGAVKFKTKYNFTPKSMMALIEEVLKGA
jgi:CheY-like chemotaxis protein